MSTPTPQEVAAHLDNVDAITALAQYVPPERREALLTKSCKGLLALSDLLLNALGIVDEAALPSGITAGEVADLRNVWLMHQGVVKVLTGD